MSFYDFFFGNQADRIEDKIDLVLQRQEAFMANNQETLDTLKALLESFIGKVDALLTKITNSVDLTPEIQTLITEVQAESDKIDAALNPPPPAP